jgi:hypothetical protein
VTRSEPLLYRPYALLAFAATLLVGTPVGLRMLAAHYAGASAVGLPWAALHAHTQVVGFFGTLIVGVAPHLFARFTGRPLPVTPYWVGAALLAVALLLRVAGTATSSAPPLVLASALEAVVFALFVVRVWRALDPPPLARVRRHLTIASVWLALAPAGETVLRAIAFLHEAPPPSFGALRELHVLALFGGVTGWVLGVLLRAGPMFVAGWAPSSRLAAALPWLLGVGTLLAAGGEQGHGVVARLGELIVLAAATGVLAGAFRRVKHALPIVGRTGDERRIFMLAAWSLVAATAGALVNVIVAVPGSGIAHLPDAVRHLFAVGTLGGVVTAMSFRLFPVLESRPLPWPWAPRVALTALAASLITRTLEVLGPLEIRGLGKLVAASGGCAWLAFACVGLSLIALVLRPTRTTPLPR